MKKGLYVLQNRQAIPKYPAHLWYGYLEHLLTNLNTSGLPGCASKPTACYLHKIMTVTTY